MPVRIQMTRQRPWRADNPDAVRVDRTTKWGNPFRIEHVQCSMREHDRSEYGWAHDTTPSSA